MRDNCLHVPNPGNEIAYNSAVQRDSKVTTSAGAMSGRIQGINSKLIFIKPLDIILPSESMTPPSMQKKNPVWTISPAISLNHLAAAFKTLSYSRTEKCFVVRLQS